VTGTALSVDGPDEVRRSERRGVPHARRVGLALAVGLGAPGLVTLLALTSVRAVVPGLLYIVAITAATVAGGRWAGLVAAAASFVPFSYFFIAPHHRAALGAEGIVALVVFVATGVFASEALARQRQARGRAEQAVQTSRRALESARRLQRVADALASALSPQQVLDAVLSKGVEPADARAGLIATLSDDGEWLELAAAYGLDERDVESLRRVPVDADSPLTEAVRSGEPVFLGTEEERDARYRGSADPSLPGRALACLPLVVDRGTIGALVLSFRSPQEFSPEQRALKVAFARQAALAVDRTRLAAAERALRERLSFLGEATALLASSLDYECTLEQVAQLAVPLLADWCAIDMVGRDGTIERVAVASRGPEPLRADGLSGGTSRYIEDGSAAARVIHTGEAQFHPKVARNPRAPEPDGGPRGDEERAGIGLRGWLGVPIGVGERTVGALTLGAGGERLLTEADLETAQQLASRAAAAVENARLFREAERRADAALALAYVDDGVVLLDRDDCVRYWNPAVAAITGVSEEEVLGRRVADLLPAWEELAARVELATSDAPARARPATLPFATVDGERWLAVAGVAFEQGVVYAIRDVGEEHALERARSDFVATASHELRTPLAAVYGAARTLRREDIELLPEQRETFLEIIEEETDRLTRIVTQVLLAGQLESGRVDVAAGECDLRELSTSVLASARLRAPTNIELRLVEGESRAVALADGDKLRQVLVNLVDNAVKYSPDGGSVTVELGSSNRRVRVAVRDEGLGIPTAEQERIFEKFYRLDPSLTRGVGGSGLGLYISRELVARMGGTLVVRSTLGAGATFVVDLPGAAG
jgi:PAS domain S-box-containing protein